MIPTEVLISIVVLSLISGSMCARVQGDNTVHLSAKIRTGTYDNITAIEFATEFRLSLFQCIKKCEATKACMFVNYNRRMKTCHLIECDECSLVQSLQYKSLCFWNKSESTLTEEATCESCMVYDVCATSNNPQCIPQGCGEPIPMSHTVRKGNMYLTNSRAQYECTANLTLIGNVTDITCLSDGYWTPMEFSCGYCPPPPEKTNAVIVGNVYNLGDNITYECKEHFSMIESVPVYESTCQTDETWTPVNFNCVGCGTPVEIENTIRIGKSYAAGHNVSYTCQQNYSSIPSSPPSVISTCATSGLWTSITFQCDAICATPINWPNATIVGTSNLYTQGDIIHYECDVAFKMLPGNVSYSDCLSNGSWSYVSFQCMELCVPKVPVTYTDVLPSNGVRFRYFVVPNEKNVNDAHTNCVDLCGTLLQITDTVKFAAMQLILKDNTDYKDHSYWIDGYFNSTESKWRTKTGAIIPQITAIWKHDQSMDGDPPCVNMDDGIHFQLYDAECSGLKRSICEQPP